MSVDGEEYSVDTLLLHPVNSRSDFDILLYVIFIYFFDYIEAFSSYFLLLAN